MIRVIILSAVLLVGCGTINDAPPALTEAATWQELIKIAERYEDAGKIDDDEEKAITTAILAHRASERGLSCFIEGQANGEVIETCADSPEALALIAISGLRALLEEQENE